jgi:hypothetical protein
LVDKPSTGDLAAYRSTTRRDFTGPTPTVADFDTRSNGLIIRSLTSCSQPTPAGDLDSVQMLITFDKITAEDYERSDWNIGFITANGPVSASGTASGGVEASLSLPRGRHKVRFELTDVGGKIIDSTDIISTVT